MLRIWRDRGPHHLLGLIVREASGFRGFRPRKTERCPLFSVASRLPPSPATAIARRVARAPCYNYLMVTPRGPRAESLAQVSTELARLQADAIEIRNAHQRGALLDAEAVEREWTAVLASVRAGMLAVPSRVAARLPHLSAHDVAEIDQEVRAVLGELGESA